MRVPELSQDKRSVDNKLKLVDFCVRNDQEVCWVLTCIRSGAVWSVAVYCCIDECLPKIYIACLALFG